MARNWAICIGVNQYRFIQNLGYAVNDAEQMAAWFRNTAKFDNVYLFTDTSPNIEDMSSPLDSRPNRDTLLYWFGKRFNKPFLTLEDNLWFFFSGHGMRHEGQDYLMLQGSDPENTEQTAISMNYINEKLRLCGAGNVMILIDACRESTAKSGTGFEIHKQQGIISIASCSPNQLSYEIPTLGHGAFTYALLESFNLTLRGEDNCATVERLCKRLRSRVPQLTQGHNKSTQTPYAVVEPETKYHLILLPNCLQPTDADIALLREDAYKAEVKGDLKLAETIWRRLVKFDDEAVESIIRIREKVKKQSSTTSPPESDNSSPAKSPSEAYPLPPQLKTEKADYTNLRDLLAAGKWKEADEETSNVMLKVSNREKEGWLDIPDIDKFPCEDLEIIDQLWVDYSKGKFGFSVQKEIYQSLGGTREYNSQVWEKFGDTVGWRVNNYWIHYRSFTYSLEAVQGHLPGCENDLLLVTPEEYFWFRHVSSLASRLVNCNI